MTAKLQKRLCIALGLLMIMMFVSGLLLWKSPVKGYASELKSPIIEEAPTLYEVGSTAGSGPYYTPTYQGEDGKFILYGKANGVYGEMLIDETQGYNKWKIKESSYPTVVWRSQFYGSGTYGDAIYAWRAPYNGTVKFEGKVTATGSTLATNPISVRAHHRTSPYDDATELYNKAFNAEFTVYFSGEEIDVQSGEIYFFSVGSAAQKVDFWLKVIFEQDSQDPGEEATGSVVPEPEDGIIVTRPSYTLGPASEHYAPTYQGEDGKFILYGKADGMYDEMITDETQNVPHNHWKISANTYPTVWWRNQFYGSSTYGDAIYAWRAPYNGTVKFEGKVTSTAGTANSPISVRAHHRTSLYDNATELYERQFSTEFTVYFGGREIEVQSGEIYFFSVGSAAQKVELWLKVIFEKDTQNPGEEATGSVVPEPEEGIIVTRPPYTLGPASEHYAPTYQGEDGKFILYGKADGMYDEMILDETQNVPYNHWKISANTYPTVWWRNQFYGSGTYGDAIYAWRAPYNGTVKFQGKVTATTGTTTNPISVRAHVRTSPYDDATELYNEQFSEAFTVYFGGGEIEVQSGEIYFFSVGSAGQKVELWLKVIFEKDTQNPGEEATGSVVPEYPDADESILNDFYNYPLYSIDAYRGPVEQGGDNRWYLYGKADGLYYAMSKARADGNEYLGGAQYNTVWWRSEFAPDGGYDAILLWRAPANGTVRFTGWIGNSNMHQTSDGVIVKAYHRTSLDEAPTEIYRKTFTSSFTVYFNGVDMEVKAGEMYYFAIDQNGNSAYDTTVIALGSAFVKNTEDPGVAPSDDIGCARPIDYEARFGTVQGENGWFYVQGTPEKYSLMTYGTNPNSGALSWYGIDDWLNITAANMTPGTRFGSLMIWVAAQDGVISIEGEITKTGVGGDGANAGIYLNGTMLFTHAFGSNAGSALLPGSLKKLEVKQGDLVMFYADCGGNGSNTFDNLTFNCELFVESVSGEVVEDLAQFLRPVSILELQGINTPDPGLDENGDYEGNFGEKPASKGCKGTISTAGGIGVLTALIVAGAACLITKKQRGGKE